VVEWSAFTLFIRKASDLNIIPEPGCPKVFVDFLGSSRQKTILIVAYLL
jgi:hypothetical protein